MRTKKSPLKGTRGVPDVSALEGEGSYRPEIFQNAKKKVVQREETSSLVLEENFD